MHEFGTLPDELPDAEFSREALSELQRIVTKTGRLLTIAAVSLAAEKGKSVGQTVQVDRDDVLEAPKFLTSVLIRPKRRIDADVGSSQKEWSLPHCFGLQEQLMTQLVISEVEDCIFDSLQSRAIHNGRTAEAEAREILSAALLVPTSDPWAAIDSLRAELQATGTDFGDSTDLIREDRRR